MLTLKRCGQWGSKEETGLYNHMIWWLSYDFNPYRLTKALIYLTSHTKAMPFTAYLERLGRGEVTPSVHLFSFP